MGEIHSLDEAMAEAASSGVLYAQQRFGIVLDYSVGSVEQLEQVLTRLYDAIPRGFVARLTKSPPSPKDVQRVTMMFGGYIGEVLKRHGGGGAWGLESKLYPGQKMMTFRTTGGVELWPHAKVQKRLENGPEDNVWHYIQVLLADHGAATPT